MIVSFGTYDAARHPRIGVIVEGLRAHGHEVVEVNRPLGFTTAERVRMLQQPWRLPLLALRLLACWVGLVAGAARARRTHGAPRAVVVGYMGHFDVLLARLLYPRTAIVLDHLIFAGDTASDRGARGLKVRLLQRLDRLAVRCADIVVTDTDEHRAMLTDPAKGVTVLVGAPGEWFAAGDAADRDATGADDAPATLKVMFFGLFTPLQGAAVMAQGIAQALDRGAALEVTIAGQGQDYAPARRALAAHDEAVTWLDWVDPAALPALVAAHDVCLGIFSDTPKGRRVVPNKVYQGLAARCVVVTSDTPPQRRTLGDACEYAAPGDPAALADVLVSLAGDRTRLAEARARAHRGRQTAQPAVVVQPLLDRIQDREPIA